MVKRRIIIRMQKIENLSQGNIFRFEEKDDIYRFLGYTKDGKMMYHSMDSATPTPKVIEGLDRVVEISEKRMVLRYYQEGDIYEHEGEKYRCIANNPSEGFLVGIPKTEEGMKTFNENIRVIKYK